MFCRKNQKSMLQKEIKDWTSDAYLLTEETSSWFLLIESLKMPCARSYSWFLNFLDCFLWFVFIVSSPLKLGGVLVFEIWTKRGIMKKLLRNRGFSWKGGPLRKREFPNCFIGFPSEKHGFITIGFFLSGKYSHLLQSIDLFLHVVYFFLENDIWNFFSSYSYF